MLLWLQFETELAHAVVVQSIEILEQFLEHEKARFEALWYRKN